MEGGYFSRALVQSSAPLSFKDHSDHSMLKIYLRFHYFLVPKSLMKGLETIIPIQILQVAHLGASSCSGDREFTCVAHPIYGLSTADPHIIGD